MFIIGLSLNDIKVKIILLVTVVVGASLRFNGLGNEPLWIDEALFGFYVKEGTTQEFPTVWLARLFNLESEFGLRSISAIAGTLTIPAIYFALKEKRYALYASGFVAVFPLFVFWSRMARPYAFAGLFVVLGWRYYWFYVISLLTTPTSVVGIRLIRQNKYALMALTFGAVIFAYTLFSSETYLAKRWTVSNTLQSSRWFYVPFITVTLYLCDYLLPYLRRYLAQKRSKVQRLARQKV